MNSQQCINDIIKLQKEDAYIPLNYYKSWNQNINKQLEQDKAWSKWRWTVGGTFLGAGVGLLTGVIISSAINIGINSAIKNDVDNLKVLNNERSHINNTYNQRINETNNNTTRLNNNILHANGGQVKHIAKTNGSNYKKGGKPGMMHQNTVEGNQKVNNLNNEHRRFDYNMKTGIDNLSSKIQHGVKVESIIASIVPLTTTSAGGVVGGLTGYGIYKYRNKDNCIKSILKEHETTTISKFLHQERNLNPISYKPDKPSAFKDSIFIGLEQYKMQKYFQKKCVGYCKVTATFDPKSLAIMEDEAIEITVIDQNNTIIYFN